MYLYSLVLLIQGNLDVLNFAELFNFAKKGFINGISC